VIREQVQNVRAMLDLSDSKYYSGIRLQRLGDTTSNRS